MPRPPSRPPLLAVLIVLIALVALAPVACTPEPGPAPAHDDATEAQGQAPAARSGPPGARWEIVDLLREGAAQERHPSDGGGRAWLEPTEGAPTEARVATPGRFTVVYEVGPLGIATGGAIYFQVAPFWGWDTPQVEIEAAPGYTRVEPSAEDIQLGAATLDQQLLGLEVVGRPLAPGDQIRITFGAGPAGARADRYAERNSRFWFAVDGDGDGVRAFLPDSPGVDVLPGPPALLRVTLPTVAHPGDEVRVAVAVLDGAGDAHPAVSGTVRFVDVPEGLELPDEVTLEPKDGGVRFVEGVASLAGVYRLEAEGPGGLRAMSNPMSVAAGSPRVLWADLHGHSNLSDGTGVPEDFFRYARDVAALDVVALTDHDHWGILPLDAHPEMWEEIVRETKRFHEPGRFVTLLGYEWTSWIHGHRHVLYFEDDGEVYSSIDPDYESPLQLWKALEGRSALTFAHHSAGGPIPTNWDIPPDPHFEPVTEIVSVHGSSEALDSPTVIYDPVPGNFVRDVLDRGYRFGFVGSGDSHDGHPGLAHIAAPSGGLAAIISDSLTREGVLEALRSRRVYATSGPRILLRAALGSHPMGSTIPVPEGGRVDEDLFVRVLAPAPIAHIDVIRSGRVVDSLDVEGRLDVSLQRPVEGLEAGEYLYVRAVQQDGGAAWSSPFYLE